MSNVCFEVKGWIKFDKVSTDLLDRDCIPIMLEPPLNILADEGAEPCDSAATVVNLYRTDMYRNNLPVYKMV